MRRSLALGALAFLTEPATMVGHPVTSGEAAQLGDRCITAKVPAMAVPARVRPFIPARHCAIEVASADLDRDGRTDYVVVVAPVRAAGDTSGAEEVPRPLLVLVAAPGGLRLAARSDRAVMCAECGGMMGDPFMGISARAGGFTVEHYGGSAWRWTAHYAFAYSRGNRTWDLVRVEQESFHAAEPEVVKRQVAKPPRDYGRIDLAHFDPDDWKGRGAR